MIEAPKRLADCGMFVASAPWKGVPLEQVYADLESEYGRRTMLGMMDDAAGLEPEPVEDVNGEDGWLWCCLGDEERPNHSVLPAVVFALLPNDYIGNAWHRIYQSEADAWTALLVALDQL